MLPDLNSVESIFARMRDDGIDLSRPLAWGFFFTAAERVPLDRVFAELEGHGYTLVELGPLKDEGWQLSVLKTEVLAADKLHRRNIAFNELAEHCGADSYDGWDVSVSGTRTDA